MEGNTAQTLRVSRNFGSQMDIEELQLADRSEDQIVARKITEEERVAYLEENYQTSKAIQKEMDELKAIADEYKARIKVLKNQAKATMRVLNTGERDEMQTMAIFDDWDSFRVYTYGPDGRFVAVRPMTSKEKQLQIK